MRMVTRFSLPKVCLVLVAAYFAYHIWKSWPEVVRSLSQVPIYVVLAGAMLSLCNYVLRYARWLVFLAKLGHRLPVLEGVCVYFAGFVFTATPGKVGELMRGVFLSSRGVSMTTSGAIFASERLSDLIAVVGLTTLGVIAIPLGAQLVVVSTAIILVSVIVIMDGRLLIAARERALSLKRPKIATSAVKFTNLMLEVRSCFAPRVFVVATALSILAWFAEGYAFHMILEALHIRLSMTTAVSVYNLSLLIGAISLLPGGIGGAEAAMVLLLVALGASQPVALAATIVTRVLTLWFAIILGALVLPVVKVPSKIGKRLRANV